MSNTAGSISVENNSRMNDAEAAAVAAAMAAAPSMPLPTNASEYAQLLNSILVATDNARRKQSECLVVRSLKNVATAGFLVDILQELQCSPGIRQLAAVLLRKKVLSFWRALGFDAQQQLKAVLLSLLSTETERLVRLAIANVVCVLARAELRDSGWPELLQAVAAAMQSSDFAHRELSMVLVFSLAEPLTHHANLLNAVGEAICAGLRDTVSAVRVSALRAVGELIPFLHHKRRDAAGGVLQSVVPLTLAVVRDHVRSEGDVEMVIQTMNVLEQIVELSFGKFSSYIEQVVQFMGATALCTEAHLRVRGHACEILAIVINSKPKMVVKRAMLPSFIDLCFQLIAEDDVITTEETIDLDEVDVEDWDLLDTRPPCVIGCSLLDAIAEAIPTKYVLPLVMERALPAAGSPASTPRQKKAAIISLAVVSSPCAEKMRRNVGSLLNVVQTLAGDASPVVRAAANFAVSYFSANLQPEVLMHHALLMPLLIQQLSDEDEGVRFRATESLEKVCENVGDDLNGYLPALLPKLIEIIPISSLRCQVKIIRAMSAIGSAKCSGLDGYLDQLMGLLKNPASISDSEPSGLALRAAAMEAVGVLAQFAGNERFAPYFPYFTERCMEGLQHKDCALKEECFGYISSMVEMMGPSFLPFVPDVLPHVGKSLMDDGGRLLTRHPLAQSDMMHIFDDANTSEEPGVSGGGEGDDDDDSASDVSGKDDLHLRVTIAEVDEKCAAAYLLGIIALRLQEHVAPHLDEISEMLEGVVRHHHDRLKQNAVSSLTKVAIARAGGTTFVRSVGYPDADTLPPAARTAVDHLLQTHLLAFMSSETNKELVGVCCDCVADLVKHLGAVAVHMYTDDLCELITAFLQQQGACQDDAEDGDEDEEGGAAHASSGRGGAGGATTLDEDHDEDLMEAVAELIEALTAAYGGGFAPYFNKMYPLLRRYMDDDRPALDVEMATGTLAICLSELGQASSPFFESALADCFRLLTSSDSSLVKSNCCFMMNNLVGAVPAKATAANVPGMLAALWSVAASTEDIPKAKDNAISAACTMLRCLPQLVSLSEVFLPILQYLPMRVDHEEDANAVATIGAVLTRTPAFAVSPNVLPTLVECAGRIFTSTGVTSGTKERLAVVLQQFVNGGARDAFGAQLAQTHQRVQRAFQKYLF